MSALSDSIESRGRPDFFDKAACTTIDLDVFYPVSPQTADAALSVCQECPVQGRCLTYALENKEQGVWGGTEEEERAEALKAGITDTRGFHLWAARLVAA